MRLVPHGTTCVWTGFWGERAARARPQWFGLFSSMLTDIPDASCPLPSSRKFQVGTSWMPLSLWGSGHGNSWNQTVSCLSCVCVCVCYTEQSITMRQEITVWITTPLPPVSSLLIQNTNNPNLCLCPCAIQGFVQLESIMASKPPS